MQHARVAVGRLFLLAAISSCAGSDSAIVNSGGLTETDSAGEPTSVGTVDTGDGNTSSTSGDDTGAPRIPPEPFELPEGCGDGVIVPGQYDCFVPVSLRDVENVVNGRPAYEGFDLDTDGRSEVVAVGGSPEVVVVLRWQEGELRIGEPIPTESDNLTWTLTRWDWTDDGRPDLTRLSTTHTSGAGPVFVHPNTDGSLGAGEWEHRWDDIGTDTGDGMGVPLDVDGDGELELIVSRKIDWVGQSNPANELVIRKRIDGSWQTVGEPLPFGGCGWLYSFAYGDFNEDGLLDVAILDAATGCDPFPGFYDPEWYRVGILLADAETGGLQLGGWFPSGDITVNGYPTWAHDVDEDGHLDLVLITNPASGGWGATLLEGRGDGTFDDGKPVSFDADLGKGPRFKGLGDLDGDGALEWLANADGATWILPTDLSPRPVFKGVDARNPEEGWSNSIDAVVGDINGDGIDDYVLDSNFPGPPLESFLMVSAP